VIKGGLPGKNGHCQEGGVRGGGRKLSIKKQQRGIIKWRQFLGYSGQGGEKTQEKKKFSNGNEGERRSGREGEYNSQGRQGGFNEKNSRRYAETKNQHYLSLAVKSLLKKEGARKKGGEERGS